MKRRIKQGWKMLTLEQKVTILHLLLHKKMNRPEISAIVGCSISTVSQVRRKYCDTKVTVEVTLKPSKVEMAKLLEARLEEPKLPL